MVSSTSNEESNVDETTVTAADDEEDSKDDKKLPTPRRRTKTGCLTCRRRRIKCGEERPICKNCVKSKRECAGYVQPLIYKQQQPHSSLSDARLGIATPQVPGHYYHGVQANNNNGLDHTRYYQHIDQPHPVSAAELPTTSHSQAWPSLQTSRILAEQLQWPENEVDWSELAQVKAQPQLQLHTDFPAASFTQPPFSVISYDPRRRPSEAFTEGTNSTGPGSASRSAASTPYRRHPSATDTNLIQFSADVLNTDVPGPFDSARWPNLHQEQLQQQLRRPSTFSTYEERPIHYNNYGFMQRSSLPQSDWRDQSKISGQPNLIDEAEDPDDPYDVEIDEMPESYEEYSNEEAQRLLQQHKQSRGYYANTLVHHRKPSPVSPILDDKYAHFFNHFISYLVPCITIFERPPAVTMNGLVKSTWGLQLPSAAINRSALAHAILAIAALHLSALRGSGEAPAVKHFTYALRRLGKLLAMPNRRHEAATLATVLLLGFYEVVSGDHSRWVLHLSGAGSFLMEHDFATMMRAVRRMRARARANIEQPWVVEGSPLSHNDYVRIADIPEALLHDDEWEVNSNLVSELTGFNIDYDKQCQVGLNVGEPPELTEKEVEDWKVKMDLYWWYCKMDIYHSALSGDSLLMDYEQWKFCPPRGPLGKSTVVCATTDHLLLILARLVQFGGTDLKRKQSVVASRGGQWIPAPGFLDLGKSQPPRSSTSTGDATAAQERPSPTNQGRPEQSNIPPSANESRTRKAKPSEPPSQGPRSKPPEFYGMMPPSAGPLHMHSSFHAMEAQLRPDHQNKSSTEPTVDQPSSLDSQTEKALAEHVAISNAFDLWASALGVDFEPVPETPETTVRTPFGPALRYSDPLIACTWALYFMGKILLRRFHPYSPPAAMMSVGVNAHFTRDYAQMIGRIVGGLHAELQKATQSSRFDPVAIAATQETTFPLMFAAVQYQDAGQRGWTINKLRDVAEGSGWKSSTAVASACETTWSEMGKNGKGPPYERTLDLRHAGVRAMGRYYSQRTTGLPHASDAESSYESQFVSHDRNLIDRHASTRTFWAMGVLSVEEDMKKLTLKS